MKSATRAFVLSTLGATLCTSCLDVAQERARRDEAVGQAAAEGISVRVDDGLAAVRRVDRLGAALWASAPRIAVTVGFPASTPAPFTLELENLMPDAALAATGPDGAPLAAMMTAGAVATERRWALVPPATGGDVRIVIGAPDATEPGAFRFAVMADVQEAIGEVQDIYTRVNAEPLVRFLLFNGDLTQRGSTAELIRFARELKSLRVPVFATLGNHELGNTPEPYHDLFGRGSFRFGFRGVQFTMLDSASATVAPTTYDWLEGWLEEGRARVHVVGMHIPPLDPVGTRNGAFASRAEAARLLSMLAGGGVDLTLYGHVHSYYSFQNAGIPAFISGGGGAVPERFDGIGRHFLVIDADASGALSTRVVRVD